MTPAHRHVDVLDLHAGHGGVENRTALAIAFGGVGAAFALVALAPSSALPTTLPVGIILTIVARVVATARLRAPLGSNLPGRRTSPTQPLPMEINPRVTFERMFGETDSKERRFARLKEKQSLLDSVTEETAKLKRSLGAPDQASEVPTSSDHRVGASQRGQG